MTKEYGPNHRNLATNPGYPNHVLDQFPWVKWYAELSDKKEKLRLKIAGPGITQEYLDSTVRVSGWYMKLEGCKEAAIDIAKELIRFRNKK